MKQINDLIAEEIEKEEQRKLERKIKPKPIGTAQVVGAKVAWMIAALAIDLASGYAIWQIARWWYGAMWIIAGAGGLLFSEWLWERIGNSDDQKQIAELGVRVSAASIFTMAALAGVVYILGWVENPIAEAMTVVASVSLLFYHGLQSYRYFVIDEKFVADNEEALAEAEHLREVARVHRAARRVDAKKQVRGLKEHYREAHGRALDIALGDEEPEPGPNGSGADVPNPRR